MTRTSPKKTGAGVDVEERLLVLVELLTQLGHHLLRRRGRIAEILAHAVERGRRLASASQRVVRIDQT